MAVTADVKVVVIGGGITGLAAAHRLIEAGEGEGLLLLERSASLGGKIATERVDGFVIEGGPDCFLASKPAGVALCEALGIAGRLRGTDPRFRRTFVKREGRLHQLPEGLTGLVPSRIGPLLTTSILSVPGRLRAGLELFLPRRRNAAEESVASFVRRRFGAEAYDWLVEPLLSGIYAGDGEQLSLGATFPQLIEQERAHRSILRMMLAARRNGRPVAGTGSRQWTAFVTPAGGLGEIVEAIERSLPQGVLRRGVAVEALSRRNGGYQLALSDGATLITSAVIVATPSFQAADILAAADERLAAALREIPFVSTVTVSVAFPPTAITRPLHGYGYVSPRAEGGPVVACTWTSNKFPDRVPDGAVLIRFFLGRAGREEVALASDDELHAIVRGELRRVLGVTAEPRLSRIFRWPKGLPQYTLGHEDRLRRITSRAAAHPGLQLAGCSYRGVGIPDCIASGRAAADRLLSGATESVW